MNYNFASIKGLDPGSLPYLHKIHKAQRAENFPGIEQNLSRIRVSKQNLEQNKRFLQALPAGRRSHFTSRMYPSLTPSYSALARSYAALRQRPPSYASTPSDLETHAEDLPENLHKMVKMQPGIGSKTVYSHPLGL